MRTEAIYNVTFNRKSKVLSENETAPIQIEIRLVDKSRRYQKTGFYIKKSQWDTVNHMVINDPAAKAINNKLAAMIGKLRIHELRLNEHGKNIKKEQIEGILNDQPERENNFIDFIRAELAKRKDIVVATRLRHKLVSEELEKQKIVDLSDLTFANIMKYNQFLQSRKLDTTTIHKRHAVVKSYIHLATNLKLMKYEDNPYLTFEVKHGKSKIRTRLNDTEMDDIIYTEIKDKKLNFVRDIYVFQMLTGLAYKDMNLTYNQIINNKGEMWIEGLRKKNSEYYSVFLLPDAVDILKKYKSNDHTNILNILPQYEQNRKLKLVAALCGIEKNLTTHTARHTAASWLLRKGVPIVVIKNILGHTDIATTLIYAKLEDQSIMEEMKIADVKRNFKDLLKKVED